MTDKPMPYDLEAERALIGCVLLWASATIPDATEYLVAEDFYQPKMSAIYRAAANVFFGGSKVDPISVSAEVQRLGFKDITLADLLSATDFGGSGGNWRKYADIVISHSLRRRILLSADSLMSRARDLTVDPSQLLDEHKIQMQSLDMSMVNHEPDDISVEDFLKRERDNVAPWVVHGLIRRSHKIMVVAPEGSGKSWLLRFIAVCAAYGIQPFRHTPIKPIKALIVDLENPEDALYDSFESILGNVVKQSPNEEAFARLWWRPGGLNLRNRVDFSEIENVIRVRQPDLVCLGPLYAAYTNDNKDFGWETAARDVQDAFRRLRKRYDFALMIEDHAPQENGGHRKMRPYGSSLWLRWPEMGIGLEPIGDGFNEFNVSRWRGDRITSDWPDRLIRGDLIGSPWTFLGEKDGERMDKYVR